MHGARTSGIDMFCTDARIVWGLVHPSAAVDLSDITYSVDPAIEASTVTNKRRPCCQHESVLFALSIPEYFTAIATEVLLSRQSGVCLSACVTKISG